MKPYIKRSKKIVLSLYATVFLSLSTIGQTVQWAMSTSASGSNVMDLITDASGNTYSTGDFTGTANFGTSSFTSAGSSDSYVCKRDPNGTVLWVVRIASGPNEDRARGMTMDASGNLYVVGDFTGTTAFGSTSLTSFGGRDIFVVKVDALGFVSWAKRNGSTSDEYGRDIVLLGNGTDLYFTGDFTTLTNFGTGVINSLGSSDLYVARITTNGIFAGITRYGSTGSDSGNAIATDAANNIYLTGDIGATAVFGTYTLTPSGTDAFISKITPPGTVVWAYKYGGSGADHGYDLTLDAAASVYATGSFNGSASFGSLSLSSTSGADVFVMKTDATGIPQWAKGAGGAGDDVGSKIAVNTATDIVIAGTIRSTSAFDNITVGNSGLQDIFAAKLSPAGQFRWAISGGGAGADFGYGIAVNSSDAYTCGTYNSAGSFGSFNLSTSSGTGSEAYTLKISLCTATSKTITASSCNNYVLNSQTYTATGVYTQTLTNAKGCDSLLTLNLTIKQPTSASITQSACGSYTLNSQIYTATGVYTQTLTNAKGCDSLLTLNLTIKQPTSANITQSACGSYTLNSQVYHTSGVYTQTLTNAKGCDSLLTLNLTIKQPTSASITQSACGSYTLNSQTYTATGVYTQTLTNAKGCDSLLTLNLTIKQPTSASITQSACGSYTLNSQTYTATGVYTQTLTNAKGCDSLLTLNLTIKQPTSGSITQSACSSYTLNSQTYTATGVYTQTLTNAKGCDSLLTLNLTIKQPTSASITQSACSSYTLNSQIYTATGVYTQTLTNAKGCDSLLTLNLTIKQPTSANITQSACGSYTLNSQVYHTSGVYTQTLSNSKGCDSIITLNLTIISIDHTVTQNGMILTANEAGATYQWLNCDNSNQPIGGATAQTYTVNANGNYAVVITKNSCSKTSACINVNTVGIEETSDSPAFRVYPNPSSGLMTISSLLPLDGQSLKIYDVAGQLILSTTMNEKNNQIDLSGYCHGMYLLELENKGTLTRMRLIKN